MEPSQPTYNTFSDSSPSSQPYVTPSGAAYNYGPNPGPAVYPVDGGNPTTVYQAQPTNPTYSSPAQGTVDNCCVDCCAVLCCGACIAACASCCCD